MRRSVVVVLILSGLFTAGCGSDPAPITTPAYAAAACGNSRLESGEICDGVELGGQTCAGLGFPSGTLACGATCAAFDRRGCAPPLTCDNGAVDALEACDGDNLGGETCATLGYQDGVLRCSANCAELDPSDCGPPLTCGNGVREPIEVCDGRDVGGLSCAALGHTGGSLACEADCLTLDSSGCTDTCFPVCGGRECGADPVCGSSCGVCASGVCNADGQCIQCTPNCDGRECGPDPVCGQSCGSCTTGGCDAAGRCGAAVNAPPVILRLATNVATLYEDGTLVFSAVVTDPDGIGDLIGGDLADGDGGVYGAFATAAGEGAYSLSLSWSQINAVRAINAEVSGSLRTFSATFFDQAGHSVIGDVAVTLDCEQDSHAVCDGTCRDISQDYTNCGACGHLCSEWEGAASALMDGTYDDRYIANVACEGSTCVAWVYFAQDRASCSENCAAVASACYPDWDWGMRQAAGNVSYNASGSYYDTYPGCDTIPAATVDYQSVTYNFSEMSCGCAEPSGGCQMTDGTSRDVVSPVAGELVITELLADPTGTDGSREWVEIYVAAGHAVDLNGLTLRNVNQTPTSHSYSVQSSSCLVVQPHTWGVIAGSGAADGVSARATIGTFALFNSASSLSLAIGSTIIDTVQYPASTVGSSLRLDPAVLDASGNDLPANWCTGEGSPGVTNEPC